MMTLDEIKDVLISAVRSDAVLGAIPEITKDRHAPVKEGSVAERIVIVIPGGSGNGAFQRCHPRICVYVPYQRVRKADKTGYYAPDAGRLRELEIACIGMFRSSTYVVCGQESCLYRLDGITEEDDSETWSNFLNVRLNFEVVNTKL
ncbi:MAG: hypothetical protein LBG96_07500 [Tannerella sp.]|jgi:hypothetical protein|nr:hypothetical protein [Tannerella sp.]